MSITEPNAVLGRIKEKLPLSEIIAKDTPLRKNGKEYVGCCPFHNEKTGSFFVNNDKGTFYCFGCGASGDIVTYVMKKRGIHFAQAIEILAEAAGIQPSEYLDSKDCHKTQLKLMQKALEFFRKHICDDMAAKYCSSRGFDKSCIEQFGIGYAPRNGELLLSHVKASGFSVSDILQSGLFHQKDGRILCYFRDRLIFPVFNKSGWPIAFGGRVLQNSETPKYLNSKETVLFQKRETLYAFNIASKNVSTTKNFILVEGYVDVVMLHQHGFNTAVASMGTSFSIEHLVKIWKLSSDPIACLDGDSAGYNAMLKIAFLAMQYLQPGKSLKLCVMPDGYDPDSFLKKFGKQEMEKILENSSYMIDFIWQHFLNQLESGDYRTPEKLAEWKKNILDSVDAIQNSDIRKLYKSDIGSRIFYAIKSVNKKTFTPANTSTQHHAYSASATLIDKDEKILLREATMLYILLERPSVVPCVLEELATIEFSRSGFEAVSSLILGGGGVCSSTTPDVDQEVQHVLDTASRDCDISQKDDESVIGIWMGIYRYEFSHRRHLDDIKQAKEACDENMDAKAWERLKELKLSHVGKKQKNDQGNNKLG
ncbi:MAG: DNA primase [Holosporales bacterium]|jgi:DNA primase|nr:DNA primase [Holosporales bacterium]